MSVRRARSTTPCEVSETIRRVVKGETDSKCWLCSEAGDEVAHVLDKVDTTLLDVYIENGLVGPGTHINSTDNLIFLCYTCHKGFDRRTPEWVFLPDPLDQFLAAERAFQAARATDAVAPRVAVSRGAVLYRPYLIREGRLKHVWDMAADRHEWHGDPVIAILRSYAIAAGLQRLPVEKGGVPQDVADIYLELVGLYGTAAPVQEPCTITVEGTLGADTIRVVAPVGMVGMMGPPQPRGKRGVKRPAAADDESDAGTMATSNLTGQSDESALDEEPAANRWSGLRSVKRPADFDVTSDLGSVVASGHSNDTQLTRAVGPGRRWKRSRLGGDVPVSIVPAWLAEGVRTKR